MRGEIGMIKGGDPEVCGGTVSSVDESAPKIIKSKDMILFNVSSALGSFTKQDRGEERLRFVSAFAAPAGEGTFLFLETGYSGSESNDLSVSLVKENVFPSLSALVTEYGLSRDNGCHFTTHGLPENFGGSIDIRYRSGERISVSDNQSPVLSCEAAEKTAELFKTALKGEKVALPDVSSLLAVRFEETRTGGGFTKAELTVRQDGTGTNEKSRCFDPPKIYNSKKEVGTDTVNRIKDCITQNAIFAWSSLPDNGFRIEADKKLTFVFEGGGEIEVPNRRLLPDRISRGFFDIELELTVKN